MTSRVISPRTLVGVGAITAVLGLGLVMPSGASGATVARPTSLPTLAPGASGASVSTLQHTLAVRRSGVYDAATVAAVKRVQAWKKVNPANGVVAAATWTVLADPTMSSRMARSSSARRTVTLATFQASVHGYGVTYRESKRICTAVSRSGLYRGRWQMSSTLWKAFGGLKYAKTADRASCVAQDTVALRVWQSSWWKPWGG